MTKNITTEPVDTVKAKPTNVATTLDADLFAKFEEVAWARRHRRNAEALREAVTEWVEKHGSVGGGAASGSKG